MSFQPELFYSQQGGKSNRTVDFGNNVVNDGILEGYLKLDYLDLPLMVKYYFVKSFFVEACPQVGLLLTRMIKWGVEKDDLTCFIDQSKKDIDFGVNIGIEYKFDFGLRIKARYNFGLSKITKSNQFHLKNSVYTVLIGYSLF